MIDAAPILRINTPRTFFGLRRGRRSRSRLALTVAVTLLGGCVSRPDGPNLVGEHRCERFFIYSICIADRDTSGGVDYIYFGDDFQVFMYTPEIERELRAVEPFHPCAVQMSRETEELSSQLLYSDGLKLSDRLSVKGQLLRNYRAAQPAVDACNAANNAGGTGSPDVGDEDPFLSDDDWDEDWGEEG